MKRVLSLLLIGALIAGCLLALASCTVKFSSPKKTTDGTTSSVTTGAPTATGDETAPSGTTEGGEEPLATTVPTPPSTGGMQPGEDTDNNFGPLHPF